MLTLQLIISAIGFLCILRVYVVHKIRMRAIHALAEQLVRQLELSGIYDHSRWGTLGNFDAMVLDITKWSAKQFYPWLPERAR